jgi:hypothetical protein
VVAEILLGTAHVSLNFESSFVGLPSIMRCKSEISGRSPLTSIMTVPVLSNPRRPARPAICTYLAAHKGVICQVSEFRHPTEKSSDRGEAVAQDSEFLRTHKSLVNGSHAPQQHKSRALLTLALALTLTLTLTLTHSHTHTHTHTHTHMNAGIGFTHSPARRSRNPVPSCLRIVSNTTQRAGMFTPIAKVSVANKT